MISIGLSYGGQSFDAAYSMLDANTDARFLGVDESVNCAALA
jgi:hypothetical protein